MEIINMSINYNEKFYNWFWDYAATRGVKSVNPPADKGKTILFSTDNLEKTFGLVDPSESPRKIHNVALYGLDLGKEGTTCYFYLCLTAKQGVTTESEIVDREATLKRYTGIEKTLTNEKTGAVKPNVYCNIIKASTYASDAFTKESLEKETIIKMIDALIKQEEEWFGSENENPVHDALETDVSVKLDSMVEKTSEDDDKKEPASELNKVPYNLIQKKSKVAESPQISEVVSETDLSQYKTFYKNRDSIYPYLGSWEQDFSKPFLPDIYVGYLCPCEFGPLRIMYDYELPPDVSSDELYKIAIENIKKQIDYLHFEHIGSRVVKVTSQDQITINMSSFLLVDDFLERLAKSVGGDIVISLPYVLTLMFAPKSDTFALNYLAQQAGEEYERGKNGFTDFFLFDIHTKKFTIYNQTHTGGSQYHPQQTTKETKTINTGDLLRINHNSANRSAGTSRPSSGATGSGWGAGGSGTSSGSQSKGNGSRSTGNTTNRRSSPSTPSGGGRRKKTEKHLWDHSILCENCQTPLDISKNKRFCRKECMYEWRRGKPRDMW